MFKLYEKLTRDIIKTHDFHPAFQPAAVSNFFIVEKRVTRTDVKDGYIKLYKGRFSGSILQKIIK